MQEINVINLLTAIKQAQQAANKNGRDGEIKISDYTENHPGGKGWASDFININVTIFNNYSSNKKIVKKPSRLDGFIFLHCIKFCY